MIPYYIRRGFMSSTSYFRKSENNRDRSHRSQGRHGRSLRRVSKEKWTWIMRRVMPLTTVPGDAIGETIAETNRITDAQVIYPFFWRLQYLSLQNTFSIYCFIL